MEGRAFIICTIALQLLEVVWWARCVPLPPPNGLCVRAPLHAVQRLAEEKIKSRENKQQASLKMRLVQWSCYGRVRARPHCAEK